MAINSFFGEMNQNQLSNRSNDEEDEGFKIQSTISTDAFTKPDDVVKTKTALTKLNSYDMPDFGITEIPDRPMIEGLKKVQKENGLKIDGVMKPGGPTEQTIAAKLLTKNRAQPRLVPFQVNMR